MVTADLRLTLELVWGPPSWAYKQAHRVWWSYQTPGGRVLGSAIERWEPDAARKAVREWLWDSTEEPAGPPWTSPDWVETDGNIDTPNWHLEQVSF